MSYGTQVNDFYFLFKFYFIMASCRVPNQSFDEY